MIKVVIVDDENKAVKNIEHIINNFIEGFEVAGKAYSIKEGIEVIQQCNPDLVFLDIQMTDGLGFEILDHFNSRTFEVIFATAYNQFALKAFEYASLHYLIKPISIQSIEDSLQRYIDQKPDSIASAQKLEVFKSQWQMPFRKISIPTMQGYQFIDVNEIIYLSADSSYTEITLKSGTSFLSSNSLKKFESILDDTIFCRIHDKYIINIHAIKKYNKGRGGSVILENNTELPVSSRKKSYFLTKIK